MIFTSKSLMMLLGTESGWWKGFMDWHVLCSSVGWPFCRDHGGKNHKIMESFRLEKVIESS